jgi:hypothetical protein
LAPWKWRRSFSSIARARPRDLLSFLQNAAAKPPVRGDERKS